MSSPLLTIAIPTFNRSSYLDRALNYLTSQPGITSKDVEIIISDNCSSDDTSVTVSKYISTGVNITYIRNESNIGAEKNVVQCFNIAKGQFIWIMGDDDFLIPNTLSRIVSLLSSNSGVGVCYIHNKWFTDPGASQFTNISKLNWALEADSIGFLNKVHYWTTFLSGSIINKKIITELKIDTGKYVGTNLPHLGWVLPAIFSGKGNIVIYDELIICQADNTGGYNLFKIFGKNFNAILDDFIAKGYDKRIKSIINSHLLNTFFPIFINGRSKLDLESSVRILMPVYWRYKGFWLHILPALFRQKIARISK